MTTKASTTEPDCQVTPADPSAEFRRLFGILESRLVELDGWSSVLVHLGASPSLIEPSAVAVIGDSLCGCTEYARDEWKEAHTALTAETRG